MPLNQPLTSWSYHEPDEPQFGIVLVVFLDDFLCRDAKSVGQIAGAESRSFENRPRNQLRHL